MLAFARPGDVENANVMCAYPPRKFLRLEPMTKIDDELRLVMLDAETDRLACAAFRPAYGENEGPVRVLHIKHRTHPVAGGGAFGERVGGGNPSALRSSAFWTETPMRNAARDGEVERPAVYSGLSAGYDPGDHRCNGDCSFRQPAKCNGASLVRAEFNWKPAGTGASRILH